jgi:undecaprenyl-diphosphatase
MLDEIAVTFTLIGEFRNMLMFSALLTGLLLLCRQWRQAIFAGGTLLCTALPTPSPNSFSPGSARRC